MSSCPTYAELLWYADTGETERLAGHVPQECPCCMERLEEYGEMRGALRGLRGVEPFTPEKLKAVLDAEQENEASAPAPAAGGGEAVGRMLAFIRNAGREAPGPTRARDLLTSAREWYFKDWQKAETLAREARAAAFAANEADNRMNLSFAAVQQAKATGSLGYCLVQQGKHEEGLALLLDAHDRWIEVGDPLGLGISQINLAMAYMYKKQLKTAEESARQSIEILSGISQSMEVAEGRQILAIILGDQGKFDEAISEAWQAVAIFRELDQPVRLGLSLFTMAGHYFALDRRAEARDTLDDARQLLDSNGDRLNVARCDWLMGKIKCADPATFSAGIILFDSAKEMLVALDNWLDVVCLLCDKASRELGAGLRDDARKDFDEMLSRLPADRVNPWVSEAMELLNALFARAEDDALIHALGDFNQRLKAGNPLMQDDGAQTRH